MFEFLKAADGEKDPASILLLLVIAVMLTVGMGGLLYGAIIGLAAMVQS